MIARRIRDRDLVDDVLSEVYVVAWRRWHLIPEDTTECKSWLLAIARRVLANHYRSETRGRELVERLRAHSARTVGEADHGPYRAALLEAFQALPPRDRAILWRVGVEGQTTGVLAAEMNCTYEAAAARLSRARARLDSEVAM